MEKAIKIAIENGWKPSGYNFSTDYLSTKLQAVNKMKFKERILLDPLFWQALGKGLGWEEYVCTLCGTKELKSKDNSPLYCPTDMCYSVQKEYRFIWHRFIDHLAEGKDINSFFENLTK